MQYYYSDGEQKFGPMSAVDAAQRVNENPGGRNYIWKPGLEKWAQPDELEEISTLLSPSPEYSRDPMPHTAGALANRDPAVLTQQSVDSASETDTLVRHQQGAGNDRTLDAKETGYPKADIGKRFGACLIDSLIAGVFLIPSIILLVAAFGEADLLVLLIALSFVLVFPSLIYIFIRDGLGEGQSWGKQLMGLMVVDLQSNKPCSKGKSFVRNLVGMLPSLFPYVGWLVEPIIVLADDKGRRLGDHAADTMVINLESYAGQSQSVLDD